MWMKADVYDVRRNRSSLYIFARTITITVLAPHVGHVDNFASYNRDGLSGMMKKKMRRNEMNSFRGG